MASSWFMLLMLVALLLLVGLVVLIVLAPPKVRWTVLGVVGLLLLAGAFLATWESTRSGPAGPPGPPSIRIYSVSGEGASDIDLGQRLDSTQLRMRAYQAPLRDVIDRLSAWVEVPMRIHPAASDRLDSPVSYEVAGRGSVPLRATLTSILGPLDLTYRVEDDHILITDAASAATAAQAGSAAADPATPPSWIERGTHQQGDATWLVLDTELPYATASAARNDLHEQARDELLDYFTQRNVAYDERDLGLAIDAALSELHLEAVPGDDGLRMYRGYALVELSPRIAGIAHERAMDRRLAYIGGGAAAVLVVLIVALAYLKLDDATRGYYSGRLKLAAFAVLVLAGASVWAVVESLTAAPASGQAVQQAVASGNGHRPMPPGPGEPPGPDERAQMATGGGEAPASPVVTGRVTLDGVPLTDAQVTFITVDGGSEASAVTNAAGTYMLESPADALQPGEYRVIISRQRDGEELLPQRYSDEETTVLRRTVEPGPNTLDFDLSGVGE